MTLQPAPDAAVRAALDRMAADEAGRDDLRLLSRHFLALLERQAPGRSVEVRVPPFAAVQAVPGGRHTRGTPRAVVETDPTTWIALATGTLTWLDAERQGRLHASGERADLSPYLPLGGSSPER